MESDLGTFTKKINILHLTWRGPVSFIPLHISYNFDALVYCMCILVHECMCTSHKITLQTEDRSKRTHTPAETCLFGIIIYKKIEMHTTWDYTGQTQTLTQTHTFSLSQHNRLETNSHSVCCQVISW